MQRLILATALALAGYAASASADPNPQLVASIEQRLARYGLQADVSQFATSTVVRLHFALSERQGYLRKRLNREFILRNAKYK